MKYEKGVVLAGGTGSRLYPTTKVINKHFLNVYDKPMIYYSLSILMLLKIRKISIVIDEPSLLLAKKLLGNGDELGIEIDYEIQDSPLGLSDAINKTILNNEDKKFLVVLGDNFLYGRDFYNNFYNLIDIDKCNIFFQKVKNPEEFAVIELDSKKQLKNIIEKPDTYISDLAVTGIYSFDENFFGYFQNTRISERNEFEITDILKSYLDEKNLNPIYLGRGMTWMDMGSYESLVNCSNFVRTIQERQNILVNSPHEIAFRNNWIAKKDIKKLFEKNPNSVYFINLFNNIDSIY
tara:strand:- start:13 stop:891 length:879 start_codon:yes stop_codon:yes gene_type:complete